MSIIVGEVATDVEDRWCILDLSEQWWIRLVFPCNDAYAQTLEAFQFLLGCDGSTLSDKALNSLLVESSFSECCGTSLPGCRDVLMEKVEQQLETYGTNTQYAAERNPIT